MRDAIINDYFNWLSELVCKKRFAKDISYRKLLARLHDTEFIFSIPRDGNRAADGEELRYRFALTNGYEDSYRKILKYLAGPCSVLEMMVALAIRCEETVMDDPGVGDRTDQWFWGMVTSLGLGSMVDSRFDKQFVDDTINRFLDREYKPDGRGGLFTIKHCDRDLRTVEIWYQLCWYLDTIV